MGRASSWSYFHLRQSDYQILALTFGFRGDWEEFKEFVNQQQDKSDKEQIARYKG